MFSLLGLCPAPCCCPYLPRHVRALETLWVRCGIHVCPNRPDSLWDLSEWWLNLTCFIVPECWIGDVACGGHVRNLLNGDPNVAHVQPMTIQRAWPSSWRLNWCCRSKAELNRISCCKFDCKHVSRAVMGSKSGPPSFRVIARCIGQFWRRCVSCFNLNRLPWGWHTVMCPLTELLLLSCKFKMRTKSEWTRPWSLRNYMKSCLRSTTSHSSILPL